jgi:hypothetical protein
MTKQLWTCALAAVVALVLAGVAGAASVTWTGATSGSWDAATGNWTGGTGSLYTDGDGVTFNDSGANTNPITLSGTLSPTLKTFANTAARFYRLDGGTLAGTGNLVVNGGGNVSFGNPAGGSVTPPVLSFTGDTVISNGSRLGFFHQTTGGPLSLGSGTIMVNGGYFGLHNTGTGQNYSFANNLTIGSGGGTVSFNGNGATESSYMPTLTGTLRLEGNLDHAPRNTIFGTSRLGNGFNDNRGVIFTGPVEVIGGARLIRFVDSPYSGGRNPLSTMSFSSNSVNLNGNTLTLDLNGTTQTAFSLSNVIVNGPGTLAIGAGNQYSFDVVTLAGGAGVSVVAGAELRLASGTYNSADFSWGPGAILNLGNNTSTQATLNVGGGMTFGTAAGQAQTFRLAPRGGDSGFSVVINGNLTFDRGSTLEFYATDDFRDRFNAGTLRFLDGSTIGFGGNKDNMGIGNSGGSAVIAFGDGNSVTAETITIAGRSGTFVRPNGGFDMTDAGTILRYTSTASVFRGYATSETRGTPQAINLPFLAGVAGTEFAPAAGTTFDARGPATGTVFTISAPVTLLTDTGTVRFMNSGASNAVGTPGPVDVVAGGVLMGVGTYVASTVQVGAGGAVAPGLSIGTLNVTGNLSLASGSFFDVEFNGAAMDRLNVSGTADLGGATLRLADLGTTITAPATFTILTAGTLTGTFAGYADGASFIYQGFTGQISYAGNQVQILNFVPEPSALALLALGGLALLTRRH